MFLSLTLRFVNAKPPCDLSVGPTAETYSRSNSHHAWSLLPDEELVTWPWLKSWYSQDSNTHQRMTTTMLPHHTTWFLLWKRPESYWLPCDWWKIDDWLLATTSTFLLLSLRFFLAPQRLWPLYAGRQWRIEAHRIVGVKLCGLVALSGQEIRGRLCIIYEQTSHGEGEWMQFQQFLDTVCHNF